MKVILILFIISQTALADTLSICLDTPSAPISEIDQILYPKIYEGLVKFNTGKKKYFPVLIDEISMTSSKVVHIKIKKNIYFHSNKFFTPTRELNTDDVIFSFRQSGVIANNLISNIETINKVNDRIITIIGKTSFKNVYESLSRTSAVIKSKEYYDFTRTQDDKNIFDTQPIGTGPYQLSSETKSLITLKRFLKHSSKAGVIKEIQFKFKFKFKDSKGKQACNINQVIAGE